METLAIIYLCLGASLVTLFGIKKIRHHLALKTENKNQPAD